MIDYLNYFNPILDFVIKLSIVFGITLLGYFYWGIRNLDREIEELNKKFENRRGALRQQTMMRTFHDARLEQAKKEKEETIAPLERERQRLLSKIPFLR